MQLLHNVQVLAVVFDGLRMLVPAKGGVPDAVVRHAMPCICSKLESDARNSPRDSCELPAIISSSRLRCSASHYNRLL